jgi:hypothetical protein
MKNIPLSLLPQVKQADPLYGVVQVVRMMAEELEILGGLRGQVAAGVRGQESGGSSQSVRAVSLAELMRIGVVGLDDRGALFNPSKMAPAFSGNVQKVSGRKGTAVFWDKSGALSETTHEMVGSDLPPGAVMIWAMYRVLTEFTSATPDVVIGLGIKDDDDAGLVAPIALNDASAPWAVGTFNCIPNRRDPALDTEPTTGTRKAVITVSGGTVLNCSIAVIGEYVMGA